RLDAELAREDAHRIDMRRFLEDFVGASQNTARAVRPVTIEFKVEKAPQGHRNFNVIGHDLRLGQVMTNLIENARSFVPEHGGRITVTLSRTARNIIVAVEDNGPGIRSEYIDRIFERFYTDRPG